MQNQYWITKQTLSQKFGYKEDECIVASDAELDTKLELLRNIQISCTLIQRVIDKYQESICYLSQEINSMGRFLKENSNEDKTRAGKIMLPIGKGLIFCAQQQLVLHEPLLRFHQELETFRQRAIGDTLQNILAMEKARTEYRAALSWMKNVSRQLDPDTSKQLEKFKKVQNQVRRNKTNFDKLALDCLQKVDLLAAARCNMLNQVLTCYHNKLLQYIEKTAKMFLTVAENLLFNSSDKALLEIQTVLQNRCIKNDFTAKGLLSTIERGFVPEVSADTDLSDCKAILNQMESNAGKLLIQPISDGYCKASEEKLGTDCKNDIDEIQMGRLSQEDVSEFYKNFEDADSFMPSTLLSDTSQSRTHKSEGQIKIPTENKNDLYARNKNQQTKSWMEIFEELDPLSNLSEDKFNESKNSC